MIKISLFVALFSVLGVVLCTPSEVKGEISRQGRQGEQGAWEEDNLNKNIVIEAEEIAEKKYKQALVGQAFDNINGAVGALFGGSVLQSVLGRLFNGVASGLGNKNKNAATKGVKTAVDEDVAKQALNSDKLLVGILALASKNPKQMVPLVVDVAKVPAGSTSDLFQRWAKNPKYITYSTGQNPGTKGQRKVPSIEDGVIVLPNIQASGTA